ncbi:hypothetical protein JKP88DRAFT_279639 [Tribonema minus]|uniref:Uncharacterized protein n=1 Tax=Tribonema minus TaxID=303371 RepID=A0A835YT70_9STRA|nr:hypothetical protein JKP88DRAFT_279639 [Tribonema minus]
MDIDAFNSYLQNYPVYEGDLARSRRDTRVPPGTIVVRSGSTIHLRQGNGLHHGGKGAHSSFKTGPGIYDPLCYKFPEPPKVVVQGPATALQVLEAFTEAVRWECARIRYLGKLLRSGGFPADQAQKYIPAATGIHSEAWRTAPVLDLQPDPLADPDSAAARSALQERDEHGLDGGATALDRFERVTGGDAAEEHEEYEAKWSEPFA